jgi:hypothetical protein
MVITILRERPCLIEKRLQAPDQGSTVGGLLSVSPPEEHQEMQTWQQSKNV